MISIDIIDQDEYVIIDLKDSIENNKNEIDNKKKQKICELSENNDWIFTMV